MWSQFNKENKRSCNVFYSASLGVTFPRTIAKTFPAINHFRHPAVHHSAVEALRPNITYMNLTATPVGFMSMCYHFHHRHCFSESWLDISELWQIHDKAFYSSELYYPCMKSLGTLSVLYIMIHRVLWKKLNSRSH